LGDLKKELKMKNSLVKILKKISEGSLNSGGTIAIAVILGALVVVAFALIPMLLIWGLQLMGIGITASFKSYIGSLLILTYLSYSRIGSGKASKED
jgi:hypothetical protein